MLCSVSRYRDVRVGGEWRSVLKRLAADGVAPIEADDMAASAAITAADGVLEEVQAMQEALLETMKGHSREEDDKFIKDVLFRRHAEEESLRYVDFAGVGG